MTKRLLILCPLKLELQTLTQHLKDLGHMPFESEVGPLKILEFPTLGWRMCLAGHGKTQFGIQTQYLVDRLPDVEGIVCAGCAGGLALGVSIFDVVVAEKTIEHDFKIRFFVRPEPEFPGDPKLIAQLQRENDFSFRVHFGVIASGDEDIVDAARARELRAQTSAIAVAWEGAGGARAAKFNKVPFLEIRGITDTADSGAPIDFSANLKVAMSNVGDVLLKAFHSES